MRGGERSAGPRALRAPRLRDGGVAPRQRLRSRGSAPGTRYAGVVTIIHWNGTDLPEELRSLPAGKYVVERADDSLTPDEEEGLIQALDSLRAGKGISHEETRELTIATITMTRSR